MASLKTQKYSSYRRRIPESGSRGMEAYDPEIHERYHCIPEGILQKKQFGSWFFLGQEINRAHDIPEEERP